ncbi:hypothetical protein tb265_11470 [Gemmatimonadetes bacterium T265]|nr:hypothetical protein tb265_11470 [Gemmatimonadetes bacterium T265]
MLTDLRLAVRALARARAFAAAVVLTLGLGIGANVTMFGVVDRLLFRPPAFLRDPATVHRVYFRAVNRGVVSTQRTAEYTRYQDLARWTTAFSPVVGVARLTLAVGTGDATRERPVLAVSPAFFALFDVRPALGRLLVDADDATPRGADVAVLGYDFWRTAYGGRDVRGAVVQVGAQRLTVVGVAAPGFAGVDVGAPPALYLPITTYAAAAQPNRDDPTDYYTRYHWRWMEVLVRRKPGVTLARATADADQAYRRSWEARRAVEPSLPPAGVAQPGAVVAAVHLGAGPDPSLEARTARWVAGVAAVVLLIACANVANLFLVRALGRARESAVRLALGGRRARLARQVLAETLVLAAAGGVVGLTVAWLGGAVVGRLLLADGPADAGAVGVWTDGRTVAATGGFAAVAGLLAALAPAWLAGRAGDAGAARLAGALRAGGRGGTAPRSRLGGALVVVQAALSVVLLVGAGLFVRSLGRVRALPLGYDVAPVLVVHPELRGAPADDRTSARLERALFDAAAAVPGVEHLAWVTTVPFLRTNVNPPTVPGLDSVGRFGEFTYQTATPDYFRTMGTRLVRGRGFTIADRAGAPRVAVVSATMARTLWPGREALGRCVHVFADTMPCATVVGVAEDIVQQELTPSARLHYYLPLEQNRDWAGGGWALLVRVRGDAARESDQVRRALQAVLPGPAYVTVQPLRDVVDDQERAWRLGATLFTGFGALALVVAAVGLAGVVGYDVARRRHELGVRAALGARAGDLVRVVLRQGVRFTAAGVVVGSVLALAASRWLAPLLFQQSATDPRVYGGVAAAMLLVALGASAAPAARAARADPNAALRAE